MAKKAKRPSPSTAAQHYGYPDINDITVGSRFFFFQTLQNGSEGQSLDAGNYRMGVYNAALNILNSNNLHTPTENEGESQIQAALSFLKAAMEYQQAHERAIWEERVLTVLKGTEYEKMAQACFPPGSNTINYTDFINILGLIETDLQDKNRWMRQLQQTYNEVVQFNNEISAVNNGLNANPVVLNAFGPNKLISKIYKNGYGSRRELSAATKSMLDSRVLDGALLGNPRSTFFSSLATDLNPIIDQLLRQSGPKVDLPYEAAKNLRVGFSAEVAHEMLYTFYDSLKDERGGGTLDHISYNEFEKMFFTITDTGEKKLKEDQLAKIVKKGKQLLNNIQLLEQQGAKIRETPKDRVTISKSTGELVGITKTIRSRLQQVLSDQTDIAQFFKQNENTNFRSSAARKKFIQELKQHLAPLIKSDPIQQKVLTNTDYLNFINQLLSYNSKFTIYDETEYAGAHGLMNILNLPAFGQAIGLKVVGNSLGKTDVLGMMIPLGKLRLESQVDKTKFASAFVTRSEQLFNDAYQEQRKKISDATNNLLFTQANSFSAQAQHRALKQAEKSLQTANEITATLKKANIKTSETNNTKLIQQQLKQALYIDETTKFSEKNFEDYGFKGGSLGANIDEQIENITWMLQQGGIKPADKDWLIFATLNSGQHLIGNFLRSSLEDYFSTAASLLLFRSGGSVAEQVAKLNVKWQDNYIRIYRLGPLFVPNSFILKLTYDALTEANAEIAHSAYGSRAMIHNNVKSPVGRRKKKNQSSDETVGVWQWAETYSVNYPKVQINLQLLGGFLDIIQKLSQRLNQF